VPLLSDICAGNYIDGIKKHLLQFSRNKYAKEAAKRRFALPF